ncbi:heavy metal translocating P-type ATPase [Balneolaceae bacterium ANBcel3]|nr:heavy metal translocating P-type ATPase [Balneolaceae bacterium ANBcel3]
MSNLQEEVHTDCGCNEPPQISSGTSGYSAYFKHWPSGLSLVLLLSGLSIDYVFQSAWFTDPFRLFWYLAAYLPVAYPVLKQAVIHLKKGDVFTEFFLMGLATIGAFYIGEYPEGVAVMLFYSIGEAFQLGAVQKARANIKALLDVRSETAHVVRNSAMTTVHPKTVEIGDIIRVKPGERVPLDGKLLHNRSAFDTSALTGESKPRHFEQGENVLAGMINLNQVIELEVGTSYENSSISRILQMVQEATSRKAKTELFIRTFARVYTPIVVLLASLLITLPYFFASPYVFEEWLYRGLVFLVISCPCALVISIPLGYFGGIGAASHHGILIKGGNYLDALKDVETVVFDKTGTLTHGVFSVRQTHWNSSNPEKTISLLLAVEKGSTHPIAKAILEYYKNHSESSPSVEKQKEIPGMGILAMVAGKQVHIGNELLMESARIPLRNLPVQNEPGTIVHIAIDQEHKGFIVISDEIKEDAKDTITRLKKLGIKNTVMLSGDIHAVAQSVGNILHIDHVFAELLPDDKAKKLEELKTTSNGVVAYAGDGINDAPVLALSDVGIAMGAMGSDAAIESADVVIQTDQPSKIATAIQIARSTRTIVWQNIVLAMGVKALFLGLGAFGLATLWEAVFADVGVALLAILNAIRIQKMKFE